MIPLLGAALAAAGALCACAPEGPKVVHAATTQELIKALSKAKSGETVCLEPGAYAGVALRGVGPDAGQATVTSCDPARRARIEGLALYQVQGLDFRRLTLATGARSAALRAYGSHRLVLDQLEVEGDPGLPGMQIDGGADIAFTNSRCTGVRLCVGLSRTDGFVISDLMIDGVRADGIFMGEVRNGRIVRVTCTNFAPQPGDHADCVQGTTNRSAGPTENLTIEKLTYLRGPRGGNVQGVFLADEGHVGYRNVRVTGGCIVGAIYNGVAVGGVDAASEIDGNVILGLPDYWSAVRWYGPAKVHDNTANQIIGKRAGAGNRMAPQVRSEAEGEAACAAARK